MLNNVVLIGKIVELPITEKNEKGAKSTKIILEVERPFRESDGEYLTDKFLVKLWKGIAEQIDDLCAIGSIIGLKGRLESNVTFVDDEYDYSYYIIAEKISFLSTRMNN